MGALRSVGFSLQWRLCPADCAEIGAWKHSRMEASGPADFSGNYPCRGGNLPLYGLLKACERIFLFESKIRFKKSTSGPRQRTIYVLSLSLPLSLSLSLV